MLKIDELTKPESCLSHARMDERIFVLLARDAAAPETIRFWAAERPPFFVDTTVTPFEANLRATSAV